jgi:hypothetical protein
MQSAVEVGGFGFAGHWAARLLSPESREATIGKAVEQAFAEFARELGG